jgi:hypothetical protein
MKFTIKDSRQEAAALLLPLKKTCQSLGSRNVLGVFAQEVDFFNCVKK